MELGEPSASLFENTLGKFVHMLLGCLPEGPQLDGEMVLV